MRTITFLVCLGVAAAVGLVGPPARATVVTLADAFIQLNDSGFNDIGMPIGNYIFIGGDTSPGFAGPSTTALASTINTVTGAPLSVSVPFEGSVSDPNFYSTEVVDNAGLHGSWTLRFTNGPDTTTTTVTLPAGATQLSPIPNLTVGGSPANPTFSWLPPVSAPAEGYRINLYDQDLIAKNGSSVAQVLTRTITGTTFTVPTMLDGGLTLDPSHRYTIQINALETRDGSGNLANSNVFARSRAYFDFTPAGVIGGFTYLPTVDASGLFHYLITNVSTGVTFNLDPRIATGYLYAIGPGDPNFQSVVLPTGIGDGKYDIYGFDASNDLVLLAHDWTGGDVFDFGPDGVSRFEVLGIEASAMLDPSNTTAFVTGVTFTGDGEFTGTQMPLVSEVPEPSSEWLLGFGLLGAFGALRSSRAGRQMR